MEVEIWSISWLAVLMSFTIALGVSVNFPSGSHSNGQRLLLHGPLWFLWTLYQLSHFRASGKGKVLSDPKLAEVIHQTVITLTLQLCFKHHKEENSNCILLTDYLLAPNRNDLKENPIANADLICFYRWFLVKGETEMSPNSICNQVHGERNWKLLFTATKSLQQAELIALTWACQVA